MKIAYLVHSARPYDELIESVNQLIKQGDHVFIMITNNDLRDKIHFVYADSPKVHISMIQEWAQEGDLSLARGTIIQMKQAVELSNVEFDYYINLTDGMIPIKTRSEIVQLLESGNNANYYYISQDEHEEANVRNKHIKYYAFTNVIDFPTKKIPRFLSKRVASLLGFFGVKRKTEDVMMIGSPYFMLPHQSAKVLVDHYDYVSETFKLSWYAEQMYIQMMMKKYVGDEHVNNDYRALGPDGLWIDSNLPKALSQEAIQKHPEALFGAKILVDENPSLYESYFDMYNQDIK